jgi:hypothetical protein
MVTVTRDSVDATISVLLFMKAFSAGARRWFAQKWGGSDLMLQKVQKVVQKESYDSFSFVRGSSSAQQHIYK